MNYWIVARRFAHVQEELTRILRPLSDVRVIIDRRVRRRLQRPGTTDRRKGDLGTMWCKIEENAKRCPCGRMAERWALLSKGKRITTLTFCRLCHPQLAHMVNRPLPIAPQRGRILVFTYGCNDVPDWTVRAQHLMGRLDPSVQIPAHPMAKLDDEFEYWKCPTCSEWIKLEESDCAVLYGREVNMVRATSCQRCRFLQCWGAPHSCKCYCHDTNGSKG